MLDRRHDEAAPALSPFAIDCAPPFLTARFSALHRALGWSLLYPGFANVRDVVWVEAHDNDLRPDVDPCAFLRDRLADVGLPDALAFMTARDISRHHFRRKRVEGVEAACLATVGLSNGERIGARRPFRARVGTVNILVQVSCALTDGALVEAMSIATQARTAAIMETRLSLDAPPITGTGTDCIVVASPCEGDPIACSGLHTAIGEAIGAAVYEATREGAEIWNEDFARLHNEKRAP